MKSKITVFLLKTKLMLCFLVCVFSQTTTFSQTTLVAGDIAFTGYISNPAGTNFDEFSFVILKNITANTVINFTDNGWLSTNVFRAGEGIATWTSQSALNAGTEVRVILNTPMSTSTRLPITGATGTPGTIVGTTVPSLSGTGDSLLAYQGAATSPTFITAIHMNNYNSGDSVGPTPTSDAVWDGAANSVSASALPIGLTTGVNALRIVVVEAGINIEKDNAVFNCGTFNLSTVENIKSFIFNRNNWTSVDGAPLFTLPSACGYLLASSSITTTGALTAFSSCSGIASTAQSFTLSGSGLTANLTVTAPTGFEVSTTAGSGFGNSVSLTQSGGTVASTTIYIRLANTAAGSPSGNVVSTSTGATSANIAVAGTVNALTNSGSVTTSIQAGGSYLWPANNTTYTTAQTGLTFVSGCNTATLNLTVISLTVVETFAAFTSCVGFPSSTQTCSVSATGLTGNMVISAPTGFEVSTSSNSNFASSISITPSSGVISNRTIYVRLSATSPANSSGNISFSSTGATTRNVAVTGFTVSNLSPMLTSTSPVICQGQNLLINSGVITGNQWYKDNIAISGATTTSYTATASGTYTSIVTYFGCTYNSQNSIIVTVSPNITPTFTQVAAICSGATLSALPTTSNNSITGMWSPALNNTTTTTYTFTPTAGQCATSATMTITVGTITTWDGTAWNNSMPTSTSKAIFARNFTAIANLTVCSIDVTNGANVNIPSTFNVTVSNAINVASGTFVIENNANLLQINAVSNTGNINIKRNTSINRLDYTYWSSPVANQDLLSFTPNTLLNRFYTYNEPTKLFIQVASPSTANFDAAKGYSLRAPNNFVDAPATAQTFVGIYTGVPNNGNFTIPVTFTASPTGGNGYNLIGNPYPSAVSGTAFLTANTGSIYFWTHKLLYAGTANYATYNLSGATAATAGGIGALPNGFIQAGQGFMFLTTTSKNITFTNTMRAANNGNQFFRIIQTTENDKLWLNLSDNNGFFSQTMLAYLPNTIAGFDDGYDAPQLNVNGISSIIANENYSIQSRGNFNNTDVVKLNLNIVSAGNYTSSKDNTNGIFNNTQDFFLKDNLLGLTHNIKQNAYNFVADVGNVSNRFEIVYQEALSNPNNSFESANITVFEQNGLLKISATEDLKNVKVFDIQGRNIFEIKNINSRATTLDNLRPQQQFLLIQIINYSNQIVTKKVVF